MTREDIIQMAREAGARAQQNKNCEVEYLFSVEELERFAQLVAAAEREACAKVCEALYTEDRMSRNVCRSYAAAIRARGQA